MKMLSKLSYGIQQAQWSKNEAKSEIIKYVILQRFKIVYKISQKKYLVKIKNFGKIKVY